MKTTLDIDDRLMAAAKRVADERHETLDAVVNDALRRSLPTSPATPREKPFRMRVYQGSGMRDTSPKEFATLDEEAEVERYIE